MRNKHLEQKAIPPDLVVCRCINTTSKTFESSKIFSHKIMIAIIDNDVFVPAMPTGHKMKNVGWSKITTPTRSRQLMQLPLHGMSADGST